MNQDLFIKLIQDQINFYQQPVQVLMEQNYSTYENYKQLLYFLEEDLNGLTSVSLDDIQRMLDSISISDDEREKEIKQLKLIWNLLELNQTKGTTFQLSEEQSHFIEVFEQQVKLLQDSSKKIMSEQLNHVLEVNKKVKRLKSILGKVEDAKNLEYIFGDEFLCELLSLFDVNVQQDILYFILDYNHSLYVEKLNQKEIHERPRLNMEEVKEIFQNFGYDFTSLTEEDQDYLLTFGKMYKIPDILGCLERNMFPRFDLRRDGKAFVSILVNSDTQTIEENISISKEKEISPSIMFNLVPALIKQEKYHKSDEKTGRPAIVGRSEDFKKNINYLEEIGFSIPFVISQCRELLLMSHHQLVSNYQKYVQYGLTVSEEESGTLSSAVLSCLISNSFDEIIDQFLEVCREGYSYMKDHLSYLTTLTSSYDLLFYRMYMASMLHENVLDVISSNDAYEMTDDNKQEITHTVSIVCNSQDDFTSAVEKHRGKDAELYDLIFNDRDILYLNQYIDPNNPLCYHFDGVYISKPKVCRIYNILKNEHLDALEDSLFYAITYHSILSEDSIAIIKRVIADRGK